ncbi:MAG: glycosyltransferase [Aliishimia sp.]
MKRVATIVIGRNEGARLQACLASLPQNLGDVVYVDSGSTDGSVAFARSTGAHVVELDTDIPFTAARARNAGVDALSQAHTFVQFIDGDCALTSGWSAAACQFLDDHPQVAVVCGRRRERFPEASVYNQMCDHEWDTPIGQTKACGGDALMRLQAFEAVAGFNPSLIAGEEPELCVRLRAEGWQIWRLDVEMTLHDAAMTQFSQFWKRARRGGYAYAEGAAMHGRAPELHGVAGTRRALIWGLGLPLFILLSVLLFGFWALIFCLIYPVQVVRLALKEGGGRFAWARAALLTLGKFAEARGVLEFRTNQFRGRSGRLIEYK